MTTTREEVIQLTKEVGIQPSILFMLPGDQVMERLARLIDLAKAKENEACAVAAWSHYADTCKQKGINPHHYGEWIASDAIRARMKP